MKLIFLGTSAGAPTKTRNVTALALKWIQQGRVWLFDCGEGTQHQFQRAPVSVSRLDHIFISHMHGDHVFGLPGLMASRSSANNAEGTLTIHGPEELEGLLHTTLALTSTRIKFPWSFEPISPGMIYEDEHCTVVCQPLNHGISSFGFAIVEKSQSGKFMPDRAKERGIEPGPSYAILKAGGRVTLPDGTVVNGDELVGARKRGRKVVICGDTGVSADLPTLAAGADILVHEATFMQDRLERAIEVGHSTAVQAAKAALFAGVQQLILTHFSPRYDNEHSGILADLLKEAQEIFPNTILAEDFLEIDVSLSS